MEEISTVNSSTGFGEISRKREKGWLKRACLAGGLRRKQLIADFAKDLGAHVTYATTLEEDGEEIKPLSCPNDVVEITKAPVTTKITNNRRKQELKPREIEDDKITITKTVKKKTRRPNQKKTTGGDKAGLMKKPKMYTWDIVNHPEARHAISAKAYRDRAREEELTMMNKIEKDRLLITQHVGLVKRVDTHLEKEEQMSRDEWNACKFNKN
jgi:hypothetical protein